MPHDPHVMDEFISKVMKSGIQLVLAGQGALGRCIMAIAYCYRAGFIEPFDEHVSEFMSELIKGDPAAMDKVEDDFARSIARLDRDGENPASRN